MKFGWIVAWCGLVVSAQGAWAQQGPPIAPVRLVDWDGKLFVKAIYQQQQVDRPGSSTTSTDQSFEEGVEFSGRGYVYHPNLVDWNALLRFGLSQQSISTTNGDLNSDGQLLGYDLGALLLREKPVSIRLFASLTDHIVNRTFARPLDLTRRNEGFEVFTKDAIPMSLLFEHVDMTETSNARDTTQQSWRLLYRLTDKRDRSFFNELTAEYEDIDEQLTFYNPGGGAAGSQDTPDTRMELNYTNRWLFGPEGLKNRLSGNVRALQRRGFVDRNLYMIDQQLLLQHEPTLSTFYSVAAQTDQSQGQTEDTFSGELGVRKQIYQSLTLTARTFGNQDHYVDGEQTVYGAAFDADYRKQTPAGVLSSSLHLAREYQQDRFGTSTFRVNDEEQVMSVTQWRRLNRPNVVAGSLNVTDTTGLIPYVEGLDYDRRQVGSFTEIRIHLPVAGIADGQTVHVDYTVNESPSANFHNDDLDLSVRFQFKDLPLAVYAAYRRNGDTLDGGQDPGNLETTTNFLGGAELTVGPVIFVAEYEQQDRQLSPPWWAYRGSANYTQTFGRAASAGVSARYEMLQYVDGPQFGLAAGRDYRESISFTANLTTRPLDSLLVRLEGEYTDLRGQDNETYLRVGPDVTWRMGLTELSVSGYFQIYEQEDRRGVTEYVMLNLSRRF